MPDCPECAGFMKYNSYYRRTICQSCGLSLTRDELDDAWKQVRGENRPKADDIERKKGKRKEWLDWYSSSKKEKDGN